jgi:O-antigen/teichoic acid export membrane protein
MAAAARKLAGMLRSDSTQAALGFALGGVIFALANLLLARHLSTYDYAVFALMLALKEFGLALGPAGVELVINRHHLKATRRLAARVAATSALAGLLITVIAQDLYDLGWLLTFLLFFLAVGDSLNHTAAALFQSAKRFSAALVMIQVHNVVLILAIPLGFLMGGLTLEFVLVLATAGYLVAAAAGWWRAAGQLDGNTTVLPSRTLWREGLAGLGIAVFLTIMAQAERLIIPVVLTMHELAVFGVLAAVVSAPFRMMQLGVAMTLLPKLRTASGPREARRLIASEVRHGFWIGAGFTVLLLLLGPLVINFFVGEKYDVGMPLFAAAIIVGYVRIWQGVAASSVSAIGSSRFIWLLNMAGWSGLVIAVAGAFALSRFGLQGVIYGIGLGWAFQAAVATWLARRALIQRTPAALARQGTGIDGA